MMGAINAAVFAGIGLVCVAFVSGGYDFAFGAAVGIFVWYLRILLARRDAEETLQKHSRTVWVRGYFLRWGMIVTATFLCGFKGGLWCALGVPTNVLIANWVFALTAVFGKEKESA